MCEYFLHTTWMGGIMKNLFIPLALLLALSVPALAQDNQGQDNNNQGQDNNNQGQDNNDQGGGGHGAPGPLMGAGLPVLLIGGGIYWIVRRKKRS
jgi:LPXTG-motif cell wall-anchored protein